MTKCSDLADDFRLGLNGFICKLLQCGNATFTISVTMISIAIEILPLWNARAYFPHCERQSCSQMKYANEKRLRWTFASHAAIITADATEQVS